MSNPFIFEAEDQEAYPQGEYSYEDFEGDFEGEGEGDYEADFEGDFEGDFEDSQYEGEIVRDHRRGGGAVRPMGFRPLARPGMARAFARPLAYRFRPSAYRYRPGGWGYRRGPWGYRRAPWGSRWGNRFRPYGWRRGFGPYYGTGMPGVGQGAGVESAPGGGLPGGGGFPTESMGSSEPSSIVMLLQRLLNRVMSTNLPVDGTMNVETRSAIRSFQSQPADATPPPPPPGTPPPGPDPGAGTPPTPELDEFSYMQNEYGEGEFGEYGEGEFGEGEFGEYGY